MDEDNSDRVDDPGRRESEIRMRNRMNSKYLDDVIEQTGLDYDEAVETIEREKKAIDNMDSGFIHSLDLIIDDEIHGAADVAAHAVLDRVENINALLTATDLLLKLHRKANRAVSDGQNGPTSLTAYLDARKADQERVKEILAAGKRVFENDLDAVEQQAKAKRLMGSNDEAAAQAISVFGVDRKRVDSVTGTDKTLKYMQKGVKKMTKGLEHEL